MKRLLKILCISIVITILGFLTYSKEIKYDKYSDVYLKNKKINLNKYKMGDTINYTFEILNISENPFYITEVKSLKIIDFLDTKIKKIIDLNESAKIKIQFIIISKKYYNETKVQSNAKCGLIKLYIEKNN
jgi:hypothetical protein